MLSDLYRRAGSRVRDLFVERHESVAIDWREGRVRAQMGLRAGAGIRFLADGQAAFFRSLDNTSPESIAEVIGALSGEPPGAWGRGRGATARGADRRPGDVGEGTGGEADGGLEAPERCQDTPFGERARPDAAVAVAYIEAAARRCLEAAGGSKGLPVVEAKAHLYEQEVVHQTPETVACDLRGGVRIELRACSEGRPALARRIAARRARELGDRTAAEALGDELGRALRLQREPLREVSGTMPAVFAAGGCGPILHEICHFFEADHASRAPIRLEPGARVAPAGVTVIDDPAAWKGRGAYRVDDEGVPARRKVLIENGVVGDTLTIRPEPGRGVANDGGHGRRASYRDLPLPRMACTLLLAGDRDPAEILASTRSGLWVQAIEGGVADPFTGRVTLVASEARVIENGEATGPAAPVLLVGEAADWLASIDAVGTDLQLDYGSGSCVKNGQALPVMVGLPTIRVRLVRARGL